MKISTLLWMLALCPGVVWAQTAYVTDILRLGIHRAEDTSDRPFDNLVSGTELEVIERVPNYAFVRTTEGQQGWVKSAYLVAEKPAQLRVAEVEAELAVLRAGLQAAETGQRAAEQAAEQASRQHAATTSSAEAIQDTLARLKQENDGYAAQLEAYRGALPLKWVAAALVFVLAGGFVAGIWWLDAAIRRRHGGFRIY
jgi:SH3 domain protein